MSGKIRVPVNYAPRDYQVPLWNSIVERNVLRAVAVWHRRGGKDVTCLNMCVVKMLQRVGLYWHLLPTYGMGRRIVWNGIGRDGNRYLDSFPSQLVKNINNTDMRVELTNGSIYQVVGTEDLNRLVGANPVGIILSEWSLMDPQVWDYLRPILAENGGWAVFIYTARGRNHGYELYQMARNNPRWFCELLTVNDTNAVSVEAIQEEREAGMPEELIKQEFYCSFDASLVGSYYGPDMEKARSEGRICRVPFEPALPVQTVWDLGMSDSTAIIFYQVHDREIRIIDFHESHGEGMAAYARVLQEKSAVEGYVYGTHWAPHDIKVRELGTGSSRESVAMSLGIRFKTVQGTNQHGAAVKKLPVVDGIQMARNILSRCWFDEIKCKRLVDALTEYRKDYNEKTRIYSDNPRKDWTSHAADAFRYLAMALPSQMRRRMNHKQVHAISEYDPLAWGTEEYSRMQYEILERANPDTFNWGVRA